MRRAHSWQPAARNRCGGDKWGTTGPFITCHAAGGKLAYSVEFVRLPTADMQHIGLAVLRRAGERTLIYCRADHISAELARSMSEQGTQISRSTIRHDHAVSPPLRVRFLRLDPAEMPGGSPNVSAVRDGEAVNYYRADMITEEMAHALELICTEETRYFVRLPVISPTPNLGGAPGTRRRRPKAETSRPVPRESGQGRPARTKDS